MSGYLLGLDVGTGGSRALLMDARGKIVASATHEHEPFHSPRAGWAEQDPLDWWRASAASIRAVIQQSSIAPREVACIGIAGQMHGAVLLDENDVLLRPALIWCDQRTERECEWLNRNIGRERLIAATSNPALTNFTLTKLLWVRANEPELWKRFRRVLLPKDYVRFRLTGEHAIDVAEASGTLMFDVAKRRWSREVLDAVDIDISCLPRVFESPEICAAVSAEGAAQTGLEPGTPVVAGAGDQAGGAVGMGIVRPGYVSATIGTSGVVFASTDRPATDYAGRIHTFCHAVPGRWHVMGVTQAAGLSLRWFRDQLAPDLEPDSAYEILTQMAASVTSGADGLLWAPYLMGERTPHLDPNARAALVGLTRSHTRAHIVRAIMEGVAFSLKDTFELFRDMEIPVATVRLGGGGARSRLWRQIQADIYGQEVEMLDLEEGAAYGAALLAGVGANIWASVDEACACVIRVRQRMSPNVNTAHQMAAHYTRYRALYPALKAVFR